MRRIRMIASAALLAFAPLAAQAQSAIVEDYVKALGGGDTATVKARADAVLAATSEAARLTDVEYYDLVLDIAKTREEAGDGAGAEKAYSRALSFGEKAFGKDSLRLRAALQGIARAQAARGDALAAEKTLLKSKAIAEAELGPEHPSTRDELALLATLNLPVKPAPNGEDRRGDYESALLRIDERARQAGDIVAQGAGDAKDTCETSDDTAAEKIIVYYGTNRKQTGGNAPAWYYENDYDRGAPVKYGVVTVSLPCNREVGSIPTQQLWKLEFRANPAKHVILESVSSYPDEAAFWASARKRIDRSNRKEALVFIHGFNVDFEGAAMRTAQLAADVDLDGAPFFYDWPSKASLLGYNADRTIATEVPQITQNIANFLKGVADKTGAERISVIAHSMGNEPLIRSLKLLADGDYKNRSDRPFDEVIFASPDVNIENFKAHVAATRGLAGNMTLYASERDLALNYSSWRSDFPRAGFAKEKVVVDGLVSVDTTKASSNFIGHDDFAGNGLDDLRSIVWFGAKPEGRCVLSPLPNSNGIWDFSPKCENDDFRLAVTLLRAYGERDAIDRLEITRTSSLEEKGRPASERNRRAARAESIKALIRKIAAAFNPPSLRARYAGASPSLPQQQLAALLFDTSNAELTGGRHLADAAAREQPAETDWRTAALASIDAAGLDEATAAAWRPYTVRYDDTRALTAGGPLRGAESNGAAPDIQKILREPDVAPASFIGAQAQGGDPRAVQWLRINNEAIRLYRAGDYAGATIKAEEALRLADVAFGKDHPDTLTSVNTLAGLYITQGRYAEAEPLLIRAHGGLERILGPEHPDTITVLSNLAFLYDAQGRYSKAEPLYVRVLAVRERVLGKEHPDTLTSVNNLAALYVEQSRYAEAEPLLVRALATRERLLGKEHPSTLISVNNLAELYMAQGRYAEAEPLYVRALAVRERVLGKEHPDTLITINNLAAFYRALGRTAEAEPLYLRALAGRERVLGKDHPETLASVNNLALLYRDQGRDSEAEPLLLRALEGRERKLGKDHPTTLGNVINLAGLYQSQGRYAEAELLLVRALDGLERVLGPEHPDTLTAINNLAGLYEDQSRYRESEQLYLRALAVSERVLGKDHPFTLLSVNNLAVLYFVQGRYRSAEPLFNRAVSFRERVLGAYSTDTINSLNDYFNWRTAAAASGYISTWSGDSNALRLLRKNIASFGDYLSSGVNLDRLSDPTSFESRAAQLISSFERTRHAGVLGSDSAKVTSDASALSQRYNLSSVAAALNASSLRMADPKRRALLDERTRLGREIEDRFKALSKLQSAERRVPAGEASIQADIDRLAKQAAAITAQLRAGDQGQAEIDGVIVEEDLAKVGAALGPDEALIAYSSVGGRYLAFVTTRKGSTAVALDVERDEIAKQVTELRKGLRLPFTVRNGKEIASGDPNDLPAFDLALAKKLHAQLIAPLGPHLAGVYRLVIVPDGPLQSLPFGVLVESAGDASANGFERYKTARFLIDRYAVSMQPSVSAIRALRTKTPRAKGDLAMLGFADPALSGKAATSKVITLSGIGDAKRLEDLVELPQMRSLLNVVGSALGARPEDLRFREKAEEADFRSFDATLPRYRMLTFATHGLVSNEIKALDLEEPALVMSLPPVKAGQKRPPENDGLLRASDIVGFDMDADLVILAACNTAAADGTPGAEPLSGLAKAFMARGARALLVSHWQAEAYSSAVLIPAMARYADKDGFSVGLAKAQRDLRLNAAFDPDPGNNTLHYAHPAFWGAFTLIGDPGR